MNDDSQELDAWLDEGDAAEADWAPHILRLASRDELGRAGARLLLDLPALAQPFTCTPRECTPGRRAPRTRSCCADLQVTVSEPEQRAIAEALPEIQAFLAPRDPRWAKGAPAWQEDGELRRPSRRCVFSVDGPEGLRCGLHQLEDATDQRRGALKPLPCRLFPLAIVELGDGQLLLTAVHRRTARHLGSRSARAFPCLRGDPARPALAVSQHDTLTELFGARSANAIARAVAAYQP